MITVKEANRLIYKEAKQLSTETVALSDTLNRVIATDLVSPIAHPYFDQSAVDGYGICYNHKVTSDLKFLIKGEIKAGDCSSIDLKNGEAIRIFTGAQVPKSVNTVVMQEFVKRTKDTILITKDQLKEGSHIREKGEQIKPMETALKKGSMITQEGIGFLASLGITQLAVYKTPRISIVVTGNEFAKKMADLENGKIFESNGLMLIAALQKTGIKASYQTCIDNEKALFELIKKEEREADVVLITGGVSVGDYDFTVPVLDKLGYNTLFHKIRQKPGKPLYFGKKPNKAAFGLPGNPRSVMICFYEYVYPYLRLLMGATRPELQSITLPLANDYTRKDDGKVHFLAAAISNNTVKLLDKQASHMLQTLAVADGLVILHEDELTKRKGDQVKMHLFP